MTDGYTAAGVYAEMEALIVEIKHSHDLATDTSDVLWKTHPLATRYRELMRIWWQLPNKDVANVLYGNQMGNRGAHNPLDLPLLTSKGRPRVGWYPSRTDLRVSKVTNLLMTGTDDPE